MARRLIFLLPLLALPLGPGLACDGGKAGKDEDGDGFSGADDCDDGDPTVYPDAVELCDGLDNDCDGDIDEDAAGGTTWYQDIDGDGHGTTALTVFQCTEPLGYALLSDDCDDRDAANFPGNEESCDEADNDCDDLVDEDVLVGLYKDADGDGYGDATITAEGCYEQDGWVFNGSDCNDDDATISPGADEYCNGIDDDCDDDIDEGAVDASSLFVDADGDGLGAPDSASSSCEGVDNDWDCDDTDPTEPQVADAMTGAPTGDGSLAAPHDRIQAAVNAAYQCVLVLAGTYNEAVELGGRSITLTGVDGAENTIIDATGKGEPALRIDSGERSSTVIQGFTLTGGDGAVEETSETTSCTSITTCTDYFETWCGGGLYVSGADPTLQDLVLTGNTLLEADYWVDGDDEYFVYSYGGGACFVDSNATLTDTTIAGNFADLGGGLYVDESSAVTISQVALMANTATDGAGIVVDGGTLLASNVLSAWNRADADGGAVLMLDGVASFTNVTFTRETATTGAGLYLSGTSTGRLLNSIIAQTSTGGVVLDGSSALMADYNNVWGNGTDWSGATDPTGTDGNIANNPLFLAVTNNGDWTDDDFSLDSGSPSVDAGDPDSSYNDADGSVNDQGAFGGPEGAW